MPNLAEAGYSAIIFNYNGTSGAVFGNWDYNATYQISSGQASGTNSYYLQYYTANFGEASSTSNKFSFNTTSYAGSTSTRFGISVKLAFNPGNGGQLIDFSVFPTTWASNGMFIYTVPYGFFIDPISNNIFQQIMIQVYVNLVLDVVIVLFKILEQFAQNVLIQLGT